MRTLALFLIFLALVEIKGSLERIADKVAPRPTTVEDRR